jgi:glycosyltransferase involved in cell wall biosynthesis
MQIHNVVCLTACPFGAAHIVYQRPQALAVAFAELGLPVRYVTPMPLYRPDLALRQPVGPQGVTCQSLWTLGGPRLWRRTKVFRRLDGLWHRLRSRRWIGDDTLVLVSSPFWADLSQGSRERAGAIVYDCYDDWGLLQPHYPVSLNQLERELLPAATLATVTTPALGKKLQALRPDLPVLRLPNAVEFNRFRASAGQGKIVRRRWGVQGPVLGFLGAIYDWVDEDLLYQLATSQPECILMLCGPVAGFDTRRLERLANVRFTGMIPYPEVPAVIDAFDVALVPFRRIERMNTVDSNKFYQYLCMGKPIVTTDFAEVRSFGELMLVAQDAEDFCRKVRLALTPEYQSADRQEGRVAFAAQNSWRSRASALLRALEAGRPTGAEALGSRR